MNRWCWPLAAWLWAGSMISGALGDEASVRQTLEKYVTAFNAGEVDAIAALWTDDGTHVDRETGETTQGREAIRNDIEQALEERPGLRLVGSVTRVQMITPDVATAQGQITVVPPEALSTVSDYSAILVRSEGGWRLASVEESPAPLPPTPYDALRELEWLVGSWIDASRETRVETTIRWAPQNAFLVRSYVTQGDQGPESEGTQVIGFDPRARQIRSWSFNSDGSFGDATWSRNGDTWLIRSVQTLADGRAASGTYVLEQLGEARLSLKLIGHEIEGEPQPASEAVVVTRREETSGASAAAEPSASQPSRSGSSQR